MKVINLSELNHFTKFLKLYLTLSFKSNLTKYKNDVFKKSI